MKKNKTKLFKVDEKSLANSFNYLMYKGQKLNRIEIMSDEKIANYNCLGMMPWCFESEEQRKQARFDHREMILTELNPGQTLPDAMSDDESDCKKLHYHTVEWVRRE
jgi:hypothetical protein